ncbi:MAG TPA: NUDIX hydrolase [Terrimicrobiaceae bacterium]|nr:NUDIX hydrolase [Terrimicrobiaceae bacterium]
MESSDQIQRDQFKASKEVSVMAWIENEFGDVLLLKQTRGNKLWTLPGGKVRQRESLKEALRREVEEEIGLQIQSVSLAGLFDRPQKAAITFLYAARIRGHRDAIVPKRTEIETVKFSSALPGDATPSLRFFWKRRQDGAPPVT